MPSRSLTGQPLEGIYTQTRLSSWDGQLYAFNRDIKLHSHGAPVAMLDDASKTWKRIAQPDMLDPWGGAINVCSGSITYRETTIEFNGTTIFTLNASMHHSMMATYADGTFLIVAMGTGQCVSNQGIPSCQESARGR